MSNLPLAFLLGLLGSLHCAVMCGPIMLSLPLQKTNHLKSALQLVLYQCGRILTYTVLGLFVGYLGNSFRVFANQEILSLIVGSTLVVFTLLQFSGKYVSTLSGFQMHLVLPISKLMGKLYGLPLWGFFAGILNGLIPCGMVYLALATALNSVSITGAVTFMLLFGLGTTPLMLMISLGGIYLKRYIKFNTNKLVPWFMLFIGTLFILRSVNLGVPFLSPDMGYHSHGNVEVCK
ncbi:sulfite exporter TauE/SafE family protein [Pedobacter sp. Du54]|uniref:sulfite exporter TauE/SafE family protein n=1 Tax=Pedobacter anseongensis TaxID=3133439 RepID=UPI0030AAEEB8